jgi:2-amino-4-hydroxy-6-hydroxymethyldihydropteridine diphosphokinase
MAQPWFVNSAALVSTALSPRRLAAELKRIEKGMGRRKRGRNAPREIDLDLLLHGGAVVDLPGLAVPHPRFHRRAFALVPASRIAGRMRHPVLGMTVDGLSRRVGGRSGVRRMKGGPA